MAVLGADEAENRWEVLSQSTATSTIAKSPNLQASGDLQPSFALYALHAGESKSSAAASCSCKPHACCPCATLLLIGNVSHEAQSAQQTITSGYACLLLEIRKTSENFLS